MPKLTILGAMLALAGGGVVWLFLGGGRGVLDDGRPGGVVRVVDAGPRPVDSPPPALRAGGGARIVGVVRRGGAPAEAGIEIRTREEPEYGREALAVRLVPGEPILRAAAGDDGAYAVADLGPGRYEVRAVGPDGAIALVKARVRARGQTVVADLSLPVGIHRLAGTAVHADGRPFSGLVEFGDPEDGDREEAPFVAPTGPGGEFAIGGLPDGYGQLHALVPGRARYRGPQVEVPTTGEVRFVVDEGAEEYTGLVLAEEDDQPLAGARVLLESERATVAAETDAEGRFRVLLPPAYTWLTVEADGYAPGETSLVEDRREVTVRLSRAGTIRGRVLAGEDGRPLGGIPVYLVYLRDDWLSPRPPARATTDGEGAFLIPSVPHGEGILLVRGGGYASAGITNAWSGGYNPHAVRIAPGAEVEVTLRASRAARIEGVVRDADGRGVGGVEVWAGSPWEDEDLPEAFTDVVVTDADGRYVVSDVPPRTNWAVSVGEGLLQVRVEPLVGGIGETVRADVTLSSGRIITVEAIDARTAAPVPGASVEYSTIAPPWRSATAETGPDGVARLGPVPAGEGTLSVAHPDYRPVPDVICGRRGPADRETFRLIRGERLQGIVVGSDGSPASGGNVSAVLVDEEGEYQEWFYGVIREDGTFLITGLPEGKYLVSAWSDDRSGEQVEAASGDTGVRVVLAEDPGGSTRVIRVRVLDPRGRPVPKATLASCEEGPDHWDRNSDSVLDGEASIHVGDEATDVTLEVLGAAGATGAPLPLAPQILRIPASREEEVVMRLVPGLAISGRVVTVDGTGAPGVLVRANASDPASVTGWDEHGNARTGPDGSFRITGLWEGRYLLCVDAGTEFRPVDPVTAAAGADDVVIRLVLGGSLSITVTDPQGAPVRGAPVEVSWGIEREGWTQSCEIYSVTDQRGVAEVRGVPAGVTASLSVQAPGHRSDLIDFWEGEWTPGDREVRLPAGLMVEGLVVDPAGRPASAAQVWFYDAAEDWNSVRVARDGTFRGGPLPPGNVSLYAVDADSYDTDDRDAVVVPAGTSDVRLRYEPGWSLTVRFGGVPPGTDLPAARLATVGTDETNDVWIGDDLILRRDLKGGRRYDLYLGPLPDDRYFLLRGLCPESPEVRAAPQTGRAVRITMERPAGAGNAGVTVSGEGWLVQAEPVAGGDGTVWVAHGIPNGPCRVRGWAQVGDEYLESVREDVTGSSVELTLQK